MLSPEEVQQVVDAIRQDPVLARAVHSVSDVDYDATAFHHSLGQQPNQASPGNHTHTYLSAKGSKVTWDGVSSFTVPGQVMSTGVAAGFNFADRTNGQQWAWYADGASVAHLWNAINHNVVDVLTNGTVAIAGMRSKSSDVPASETTSSTSYVDLATVHQVTGVVVPPSGNVKVSWTSLMSSNTAGFTTLSSIDAHDDTAGASVFSPSDTYSAQFGSPSVGFGGTGSRVLMITGLTPGNSLTIKLQHRASGGTSTISRRHLIVEPML